VVAEAISEWEAGRGLKVGASTAVRRVQDFGFFNHEIECFVGF